MAKKKEYGIDQVAHYFLSDPNPSRSTETGAREVDRNETAPSSNDPDRELLRIAFEIDPARAYDQKLVDAAGDFLLHYLGKPEVSRISDIASPDFGTADLSFATRGKDYVALARLNTGRDTERFVVTAVTYHLWIRDLFRATGSLLNGTVDTELFVFSPEFPKALCRTLAAESGLAVYLIRYRLFQVEKGTEPVVHFQPILSPSRKPRNQDRKGRSDPPAPDSARDKTSGTTSPVEDKQEYEEFMRLRRRLED